MNNTLSKAVLKIVLSLAAASANAGVFIDTGTPNNTWSTLANIRNFDTGYSSYESRGYRLSFTEPYNITGITSYFNTGNSVGIAMTLFADNSGTPSSLLHQGIFFEPGIEFADTWAGLSGINWQVNAGNYWLVYNTGDGIARIYGSSTEFETVYKYDSFGWEPVGRTSISLRITGDVAAVPEPSTYGLALGGLALVAVALKRRNKPKA
jgi:hypothetical protein